MWGLLILYFIAKCHVSTLRMLYNIIIETDSMIGAGHMPKAEAIIGTIRTLGLETISERIKVKVNIIEITEEYLRKETGHITEEEAGVRIIDIGR